MPHPESSGRSTFLTILMLTAFGAGVLLYAAMLMGPFVFAALGIAAVIGGVGACHYLLWGRSMDREVEPERSEAAPEGEEVAPETNGWPTDGPHGTRRF